ncbi:hypothetical protein ACPBEI_07975 [Latilactobacillus sakei]
MTYLSFKEYESMGRNKIKDEATFKPLESDAEDLFDIVTNGFYVENPIDDDSNYPRVELFKKALALQCEFTNSIGASTPYDIAQAQVNSVSVGRTRLEMSASVNGSLSGKTGIYNVAMRLLAQTGLLSRRVNMR